MIDVSLNRRVENYLGRLVVYFARPQIFDADKMALEAETLMLELDSDRINEVRRKAGYDAEGGSSP